MLKFSPGVSIKLSDRIQLHIENGSFGESGDLEIITPGTISADSVIEVSVIEASGLLESREEFMNTAPSEGYLAKAVIPLSSVATEAKFYVRTRSGKFAALHLRAIPIITRGEVGLRAIIYHNPTGSRNLEFDHNKWLNRQ